jgi:hypothetical protein
VRLVGTLHSGRTILCAQVMVHLTFIFEFIYFLLI